jgi:nucleotide-binding universal stress UspA family protein
VSTNASPTILVCYDGSDRAAHAIAVTGQLFPGATTKVLHIWETVEHIVARYAVLAPYLGEEIDEADAGVEQHSTTVAQAGAKLAQDAGLNATAHSEALASTIWECVVAAAARLDADVIVTGTRGLHGVREAFVGTLSHALLQHSELPVLAIPSPDTP